MAAMLDVACSDAATPGPESSSEVRSSSLSITVGHARQRPEENTRTEAQAAAVVSDSAATAIPGIDLSSSHSVFNYLTINFHPGNVSRTDIKVLPLKLEKKK